jgi:hypothetical protein
MKGPENSKRLQVLVIALFGIGLFLVMLYGIPLVMTTTYEAQAVKGSDNKDEVKVEEVPKATHLETPDQVKAVYMTSWVAGTPSLRANIINLIESTELNSVVIDIKDDTGKVSFAIQNPELQSYGSEEVRIQDLRGLLEQLHAKDIYVIGRIASFQDPHMVKMRPELAVKRASDGAVWRDRKGLTWIDAGAEEHWKYLTLLAKESYEAGFDEIQFDYIRFPSDGNMQDISFPYSENLVKHEVIKKFYAYIHKELKDTGMKLSADLFGMTTTNYDDLGIGQVIEDAFPYFDYISPMVYPSHYPSGFFGHKNVNAVPYEIIKIAMQGAQDRLKLYNDTVASTTVEMRPWLQDNDYPVPYTADMVRAQIQATYDVGIDSWMLWDAGNTYTRAALKEE